MTHLHRHTRHQRVVDVGVDGQLLVTEEQGDIVSLKEEDTLIQVYEEEERKEQTRLPDDVLLVKALYVEALEDTRREVPEAWDDR